MSNADQLQTTDPLRERVARIFRFIAALHERRNPAPRLLSTQPWILRLDEVPVDEVVKLNAAPDESTQSEDAALLSVGRAVRTPPPKPPAQLEKWILGDWRDLQTNIEPVANLAEAATQEAIVFHDDPERVVMFEAYRALRDSWTIKERTAVSALELFERMFELYGTLQREGERFELMLGNGMLRWDREDGAVRFPLLLRPVTLEFVSEIPEFRIVDSSGQTDFNAAIFRSMNDVDGRVISRFAEDADKLGLHPLRKDDMEPFLSGFVASLSAKGEFRSTEPTSKCVNPVIYERPTFYLRSRVAGFADSVNRIVEDIEGGGQVATSLLNIAGGGEDRVADTSGKVSQIDANEDDFVLFTKPSNREQLNIARTLDQNDCVLVQGPPGTGKTHTIANLLGHLLAEGKSVLVTSHTTKALKVLREKVVAPLQPLCISVLDESSRDGEQLKASIEGILERLGGSDAQTLERQVVSTTSRRSELIDEVRALRESMLVARQQLEAPVVRGARSWDAIEAARYVASERPRLDWIPGPLVANAAFPATEDEVVSLYASNAIAVVDERNADCTLPADSDIPKPTVFESLVATFNLASTADDSHYNPQISGGSGTVAVLDEAMKLLEKSVSELDSRPTWTQALLQTDENGEGEVWRRLADDVTACCDQAAAFKETDLSLAPQLPQFANFGDLSVLYDQMREYVEAQGRPPSWFALMTKTGWKVALNESSVLDVRPTTAEHFGALAEAARLRQTRDELRGRWNRQVAALGGPTAESLGPNFEIGCRRLLPAIDKALRWHEDSWKPALLSMDNAGTEVSRFFTEIESLAADADFAKRCVKFASDVLPLAVAFERARRQRAEITATLRAMSERISPTPTESPVVGELRKAIEAHDVTAYSRAHGEIIRLTSLRNELGRRSSLLVRIAEAAPGWAAAIEKREGVHGEVRCSYPAEAWDWRQLEEEMARREAVPLDDLARRLEAKHDELRNATTELVDAKAWLAQTRRTNLEQRSALGGFAAAKKRMGKGTGKRAAVFAKLAREQMTKAVSAVPVWIMPLVRAAEMYDPRKTRFDVVIVDEASQADVMGLFAFYLGKKVVVVGDDEQVSPSAVGEKVDDLGFLIDEFLFDIPNGPLYGGQLSLYDLAKQSFGGTIALREHFRCLPEIIEFSNRLSYAGAIRPLRERLPTDISPGVVSYRVDGRRIGKVNEVEARTIAALILACTESRAYDGKTIGVIALLGSDQAKLIDEWIRKTVPLAEIDRRRIVCGNAAQFQGDERHVMFLSVVDSRDGAQLVWRDVHSTKQRYNVAGSRAQDQMWIVHSLDPTSDLKTEDIRRRLIEHAYVEKAMSEVLDGRQPTKFQHDLATWLTEQGFFVKINQQVGLFRLDLVIGDCNGRAAIVCGNQSSRSAEALLAEVETLAVLERVGWRFIFASPAAFIRNRDEARAKLLAAVDELSITRYDGFAEPTEPSDAPIKRRAAEILTTMPDR